MIDKNDPRLTAYLLDELEPQEVAAVEAAIAASPELQEHVEGLRGTIGVLHRAFGAPDSDETTMSESQLNKIEAAASGQVVAGDSAVKKSLVDVGGKDIATRIRWRNFAIAALVLYAVGLSAFAFQKPSTMSAIDTGVPPSSGAQRPADRSNVHTPLEIDPPATVPLATNGLDSSVSMNAGGFADMDDVTAEIDDPFGDVAASDDAESFSYSDPARPALAAETESDAWSELRRRRIELGNDDANVHDIEDRIGEMAMGGRTAPGRAAGGYAGGQEGSMSVDLDNDMDGNPDAIEVDLMGMEMAMDREQLETAIPGQRDGFGDEDHLRTRARAPRSAITQIAESDADDNFAVPTDMPQRNFSIEAEAPAGSEPSDAGVIGDTQIQFVPELGTIVVRGAKRDVTRVLDVIKEIEDQRVENDEQPLSAIDTPEEEVEEESIVDTFTFEGRRSTSNSNRNDSGDINGDGVVESIEDETRKMAAFRLRKKAAEQKRRTWRPATAATNRARLSVGHHDDLPLTARDTYVRIDGFRARVFFDCYYYNDRPQQLEGQFMLRLPSDASLHYFAFGPTSLPTPDPVRATGKPGVAQQVQGAAAGEAVRALRESTATTGSDLARRASDSDYKADANSTFALVKAARVAPRQKAALAYDETVRRRVDPALVEWAGPGIFQTRVFPLVPNQLHRIIVGYDVTLRDDGNDRLFSLQLPEGEAGGRVEFDIAASAGTTATIAPETEAFVSGGRAYYRFLDAEPRDYTVRLAGTESVVLNTRGKANDDYFVTRLIANLPDAAADSASREAVLMLDTSWSDRPAAFSRRLELLKHLLDENRDSIERFAVLFFNVEQRWWQTKFVANDEANVAALLAEVNELALEGATDLHGALSEATTPAWGPERGASGPQPNFFLFSDASATWGKTDLGSLADPLSRLDRDAGGGALFAYHLAGHRSDKATQQWLADSSGGAVFDVAEEAELVRVAIAHRSRPWKIVAATARGADEILIQGSSKTVYPNQPLVIAGRGKLDGPLTIVLARGTEKETLEFEPRLAIASPAAARYYGQLAVDRLEPYADNLEELTVAFARYFRVPGRTCSMVMLESQEDYERLGVNVPPEEDQLVIASTSVETEIEEQESHLLQQRENPRLRFVAWVESLETASLLNVSTALKLAMKRMPDSAFRFDAKPLACRSWKRDQLGTDFVNELNREAPGFDAVMEEAERKLIAFGADDALKSASTLVEAKPSDVDTLRSVAFRAMQWQRSDQAAPLLWRLTQARPYQPQCLLLLARAMAESGDTDSAIVCYDLVTQGNWNARWSGAKDVATVELLHVLERVDSGESKSSLPKYARARLQQLRRRWSDEGLDVAVVMHWNTDRTDVDLHVTEPSGEECYYSHNRTKSGGQLTQDITEGLGPEMYSLETAPVGEYRIEAKYYRADANRTKAPTEALLTVLRNVGRPNAKMRTERITLHGADKKQLVMRLRIDH